MATPTLGPRPGSLNLRIRQGSTFAPAALTYRDPDGVVVDLTGMTARAKVKDALTGALLVSLTTENGGITLGDAAGTIALFISATDTEALDFDAGLWDFELVSGTVVTPLLAGNVVLDRERTD